MDSRRWMDVDGSWVYSTNPRRQTDSHLKYSTLPGRNNDVYRGVPDASRRPADNRGKYGTIPGRYPNRGPVKDSLQFKQWSPTRLQRTGILKDSTNWEPFLTPGTRMASMGNKMRECGFEQNEDSRIKDRIWYEWDTPTRNAFEFERRHKLPRDLEMGNLSPARKDKQKRKLKVDSIYGQWQPEYKLENKNTAPKRDEWEPLPYPPKALQNQMLSQKNKLDLPPPDKTVLPVVPTATTNQEKKSWWSKLVKHSKFLASDVISLEAPQDKANIASNDHRYIMNHGVNKLDSLKENVPQIRKRKGPPPYVPPPSYNYPHRTFPIRKYNSTNIQGPNMELTNSSFQEDFQESRDTLPRYSVDQLKAPKLNVLHTNVRENREEVEKKTKHNTTYHSLMQDRKLPRACNTWAGSTSDDYLDHIYEVVEGGSSPAASNGPTSQKTYQNLGLHTDEMIYGTVAIPLQRDPAQQHTLSRVAGKGTHDRSEALKSKNTTFHKQRQMPPLDERPPIPLHGVKLPRELGFSYTSGISKPVDNTSREKSKNIKEPDNYDSGDKWRKPLRVISSKESKMRVHSNTAPYTSKHGWYSHTLPLNKEYKKTYKQEDIAFPSTRSKSLLKQDAILPKWQEPGKVSTLPSRGRDQSRWRGEDKLRLERKHNLLEPSVAQSNNMGRRRKVVEKNEASSPKESDGFFVIDATCVVVKAEYIFPPVMEQVTFLHREPPNGEDLTDKKHSPVPAKKNTIPKLLPHSGSTVKTNLENSHSETYRFKELSTERAVPTLTERAVRILGLSICDIESLSESQDISHSNASSPKSHKTHQVLQSQEHNPQGEKCFPQNKNDYKLRDCKGLPCIQEVAEFSNDYDGHMSEEKNTTVNAEDIQLGANVQFFITHNTEKTTNIHESIEIPKSKPLDTNDSDEQDPQVRTESPPVIELDVCLPEESSSDIIPSIVSDYKSHQTTLTEQCQDVMEPMLTEKTIKSPEYCVSETPENTSMLDAKDTECLREDSISVVENLDSNEKPSFYKQKNRNKYVREGLQSASSTISDEIAYPHISQSRQRDTDSYQIPTPPLFIPLVKAYARRPNYYAKDLREAVSRIRRHTAPDSDTDEDMDHSIPEPVHHHEVQMLDESVTTGSSDTSDSEVTVIMCIAEKQDDEVSLSNDSLDTESLNEDVTIEGTLDAPSAPANFQDGAFGMQCDHSHEHQEVLDLNSCINEILQELNKTEQEFFSDNEGQPKESLAETGYTEEGTDTSSSK